jgi:large subunit ribosomal protein L35
MKTRRGAAKRFRKTGTGKIRRAKAYRRHILTKMSSKRKRQLRRGAPVSASDAPRVNQLVPYL